MTSLIIEVYDAFKSVGMDDETARKAAGALSNNDSKIDQLEAKLDRRIDQLEAKLDRKIDQLETRIIERLGKADADTLVLKWMVGVMFAGVASLVARSFF